MKSKFVLFTLLLIFTAVLMVMAGCGGDSPTGSAPAPSPVKIPSISNLRISGAAGTISVIYDLDANAGDTCGVKLYYSIGGSEYKQAANVTGSTAEVLAGKNKSLKWNAFSEVGASVTNAKIKISAFSLSGESANVESSAFSTYVPPSGPGFDSGKIIYCSTRDIKYQLYMMNADGSNQSRLTDGGYNEMFPYISGDGSKILFVSDRSGTVEIYAADSDGSNIAKLTNTRDISLSGYGFPAYNYDKTKVIFTEYYKDKASRLVMMSIDGSAARAIGDSSINVNYGRYSRDGGSVVFMAATAVSGASNEIYIMNVSSSAITKLTDNGLNNRFPSLSPDGTAVVFTGTASDDNGSEIYVMDIATKKSTRLTFNDAYDSYPSFSPDGKKIVFASVTDGNSDIYTCDLEGKNVKRLTQATSNEFTPAWGEGVTVIASPLKEPVKLSVSKIELTSDTFDLNKVECVVTYSDFTSGKVVPAWSVSSGGTVENGILTVDGNAEKVSLTATYAENGKLVSQETVISVSASGAKDGKALFSRLMSTGNFEIHSMNANGSAIAQITKNEFFAAQDICFSSDGKKAAFAAIVGSNLEIFSMELATMEKKRLTSNDANDSEPSFSKDGNYIIFTSSRNGNKEIYVMNADGSNQARITNSDSDDFSPCFSLDGDKAVFTSARGGYNAIYSVNFTTGETVKISGGDTYHDSYPSYSPDGRKIAFQSDRDGVERIYEMDENGANQKMLTNDTGGDWYPKYSPDQKYITFVSKRDGNWEVYYMNADGSNQARLTNNTTTDDRPAFTSDGKYIVYSSGNTGDFYAITPDKSEYYKYVRCQCDNLGAVFSKPLQKVFYYSNKDSMTFYNLNTGSAIDFYNIYAMSPDGSNVSRVTKNNILNSSFNPAISRDGLSLAYCQYTGASGEPYQIYVSNLSTGATQKIAGSSYPDKPAAFTYDGGGLIFSSNRTGNSEIYKIDIATKELKNLTNNPSNDDNVSISPDGTSLIFGSNRGGNYQIYKMDAGGNNVVKLTDSIQDCNYPFYSPDGLKFMFVSKNGTLNGFYISEVGSSARVSITSSYLDFMPFWYKN